MKSCGIGILVAVALLMAFAATQANAAWGTRPWGAPSRNVSAFVVAETKSDESGYGVAMSISERDVTDLAFLRTDSLNMVQVSKLSPTNAGEFPVHVGLSLGYADKRSNAAAGTPSGLMTGLQVSFLGAKASRGVSFDLRASTMKEGFNPLKWLTNPDLLWVGAGISFGF